MAANEYERDARRRKALALVAWCQSMGFKADSVLAMTPTIRAQACKDAGVNPASDETWLVVLGLLGAYESPAFQAAVSAEDPFAGLS